MSKFLVRFQRVVRRSFARASASKHSKMGSVDISSISPPEYGARIIKDYPDSYKKVLVYQGDITKLKVDAIVNAANEGLRRGGGACGSIFQAAGDELEDECESIGFCKTGSAVITSGYNLPAKYIIHAVGPIVKPVKSPPTLRHQQDLRSTYEAILKLCASEKLKSVAIPCISTGIFGYAQDKAVEVVVPTVLKAMPDCVEKCIFCTYLAEDTKLYTEALNQ